MQPLARPPRATRSASEHEYRPFLDQLSSGWFGKFSEQESHKQLLIQPMIIPDLTHTQVNTPIVGMDDDRELYIAPSGRPTRHSSMSLGELFSLFDRDGDGLVTVLDVLRSAWQVREKCVALDYDAVRLCLLRPSRYRSIFGRDQRRVINRADFVAALSKMALEVTSPIEYVGAEDEEHQEVVSQECSEDEDGDDIIDEYNGYGRFTQKERGKLIRRPATANNAVWKRKHAEIRVRRKRRPLSGSQMTTPVFDEYRSRGQLSPEERRRAVRPSRPSRGEQLARMNLLQTRISVIPVQPSSSRSNNLNKKVSKMKHRKMKLMQAYSSTQHC